MQASLFEKLNESRAGWSRWKEGTGREIYEQHNVHSSALIWLLFLVDLVQNVMTCLNGIMTCKYLFKENSKTKKEKKKLLPPFFKKAEKEKFPRSVILHKRSK